jgi:hypothetical protein
LYHRLFSFRFFPLCIGIKSRGTLCYILRIIQTELSWIDTKTVNPEVADSRRACGAPQPSMDRPRPTEKCGMLRRTRYIIIIPGTVLEDYSSFSTRKPVASQAVVDPTFSIVSSKHTLDGYPFRYCTVMETGISRNSE